MYPEPSLAALDEAALEASRSEGGQSASWFAQWRFAINGVRSRLAGANASYRLLTEWLPGIPLWNPENDVAVCLFCMDSTLECWTFALNAFGWGLSPEKFIDLGTASSLREVSPANVFGKGKRAVEGYEIVFPNVASLWRSNEDVVRVIVDNHDVSKHRHANLSGWTNRSDPPPGLLKQVGLHFHLELSPFQMPMRQILLPRNPKLPIGQRPQELEHWVDLIEIKPQFDALVERTPLLALEDVRTFLRQREAGAA